MAWLTPPIYKPAMLKRTSPRRFLGGGRRVVSAKKLVYEQQIAQDVTAQSSRR